MLHIAVKLLNKLSLSMMVKTEKTESLALVDSIGLNGCFVIQKECPPMLKFGVREKWSVSYCVRKGYNPSYWRTHRVQSGLKLIASSISVIFLEIGGHIAFKAD